MTPDPATRGAGAGWTEERWTGRHWLVLVVGLVVAAAIRIPLLPLPGLAGDIHDFASWVHAIAVGPFGQAYDRDITFPPVMVYLWGALGALVPGFQTATDASDPGIRVAMKLLPTLADEGLVVGVAYALRTRPWWAVGTALAIALHPAVIDVSALFGQYESIYVLFGLIAYLLAIQGRNGWATIVLAIALMTKPQALPFLVPFGAWFVARVGWLGAIRLGAMGAATIVVVWLPFVAAGGPANYLQTLAVLQSGDFAVLSLRAWNPWWILQVVAADGQFVSDSVAFIGPLTLRHVGIALAALLELVVVVAILRRATPERLALGLAAASLATFIALTTMHERYTYPALIFLALLFPDRRAMALWTVVSIAFTLNLLAAVPPGVEIGSALAVDGPLSVVGSLAMTAVMAASLWWLAADRRRAERGGIPA